MKIKKVDFFKSSSDPSQCPAPTIPEYAFIGRSNVGKSSLINMLANRKSLAKTSGKPGKTQLINHFIVDDSWYIVDLPGYGYARVAKTERKKWHRFTVEYLNNRQNLMCVFVLVDGRISPQKVDLEFMTQLGTRGIPFVIVFTKMEKVKAQEKADNFALYQDAMLETWEIMPPHFYTSAVSGEGKEEIFQLIADTNLGFDLEV